MQPRQRGSSIASTVAKCFDPFTTVEEILDNGGDHPEFRTALIDCLGQFRIWSGNTGAHETGNSSLDHRLRDAPSVSKSVLQLLSSLDGLIIDVRLLLTHPHLSSNIFSHNTDSSNSESSEDEDVDGSSEVKQIFNDISELIGSLHRLSMSIRNPTVTRRYKKDMSLDTSFFESYDIEHVGQKFPEASTNLAYRLGKANSRRRLWLKSRELHAEKLTQDLKDDCTSTRLSKTTASTFKSESIFDSHARTETYEFSTSMSATSYAPSVNEFGKRLMPSMPKEAKNEQPFECPYCHRIERIPHKFAWKKHVYSDLRPYLCTFEDCTSPTETYDNRRAWFHHELQNHRRSWACSVHCEMTFGSEDSMVAHTREHSPMTLTDAQARTSARMCMIPFNQFAMSNCPICDLTIGGLSKFRKHFGGHLEELALFALPATMADSGSEDESISCGDEIGETMGKIVLKEDEKDGKEDRTGIIASAQVTKTSNSLKRSKHSASTSSKKAKLLKSDAKVYDQVDKGNDQNDEQRFVNIASASSEELELSTSDADADHYQVDERGDKTGQQSSPNSPSASSDAADHHIDEKDNNKTEENSIHHQTPTSPGLANMAGSAPRPLNREYGFGGGGGGGDVGTKVGWFCCACGDGPKDLRKEVKCVSCNHVKCTNCSTET